MTSIIINYPDKNSFSKVLLNPSDPNPLKIWVGDLIEIKHIIVFGIEDKNGDEQGDEQHICNLIIAQEVINLSTKTDADTSSDMPTSVRGSNITTPHRGMLTPNRERSELDGMSESENDLKIRDGKSSNLDTDIDKEDTDIEMV